jgi:hypothetical protein
VKILCPDPFSHVQIAATSNIGAASTSFLLQPKQVMKIVEVGLETTVCFAEMDEARNK